MTWCFFYPLFLFADDIFPCFVYAVITVKTVALKTPNNQAVKVTEAPAIQASRIFFFSEVLQITYFLEALILTTAKHNFYKLENIGLDNKTIHKI